MSTTQVWLQVNGWTYRTKHVERRSVSELIFIAKLEIQNYKHSMKADHKNVQLDSLLTVDSRIYLSIYINRLMHFVLKHAAE